MPQNEPKQTKKKPRFYACRYSPDNPPLYVQLPDETGRWLREKAEREGRSLRETTIRIFDRAKQLEEVVL